MKNLLLTLFFFTATFLSAQGQQRFQIQVGAHGVANNLRIPETIYGKKPQEKRHYQPKPYTIGLIWYLDDKNSMRVRYQHSVSRRKRSSLATSQDPYIEIILNQMKFDFNRILLKNKSESLHLFGNAGIIYQFKTNYIEPSMVAIWDASNYSSIRRIKNTVGGELGITGEWQFSKRLSLSSDISMDMMRHSIWGITNFNANWGLHLGYHFH